MLGIAVFLVARAAHLVIHFQTLGLAHVIGATLIFTAFATAWLVYAIRSGSFRFTLPTTATAWGIVVLLAVFAWLVTTPVNAVLYTVYAPEFPVQQLDTGGGAYADTFFHSDLIFSIMQFGYPSTGIDGVPFVPYHVLSHYVDAGILNLTGLTPLMAYGFLFQLKIMLFASAALTLVWYLLRDKARWIQLVAPVALLPVFAATWHVVGSHGLWVPSVLLIICTPFLSRILFEDPQPTPRQLVVIGLIGVALSLGKISTGFMFMLVVGVMLLLKNAKRVGTYVLGVLWAIFIVAYSLVIASDRAAASATSTGLFDRVKAVARFVLLRDGVSGITLSLYAVLAGLVLIAIMVRSRAKTHLLIASAAGLAFATALAAALFDSSDRWYFTQALFFFLLMLLVALMARSIPDAGFATTARDPKLARRTVLLVAQPLALLMIFAQVTEFNALSPSPVVVEKAVSTAFRPAPLPTGPNLGVIDFADGLAEFMTANSLTGRDTELFVPSEIWANDISQVNPSPRNHREWAMSMMLYSITGVPFYKGAYELHGSYGFSAYSAESLAPTSTAFAKSVTCTDKTIVELTSWSPAKFHIACEAAR